MKDLIEEEIGNITDSFVDKLSPERKVQLKSELEKMESKKMSAPFGGISLDEIPQSIERGTYKCKLVSAKVFEGKKEFDLKLQKKLWVIVFEVSDTESDYLGETASLFVNIFTHPDLKMDKNRQIVLGSEVLDSKTQKTIKDSIKFYRKICQQLGFTVEEINEGVDFQSKINEEYLVSLYASKDDNKTSISTNDPIRPVAEVDDEAFGDLI